MPIAEIQSNFPVVLDAHYKWLKVLKEAQDLVDFDVDLQARAAKGFRLKERHIPAEVLGRMYGQYCNILNKLYDAYLNNVQLQKASYFTEIISVIIKRISELRNEIVNLIVNDYIYVDGGLIQTKLTPDQIQIVVPYHYPLECRAQSSEKLLQRMWSEAEKRKNGPPKKAIPSKSLATSNNEITQSPEESSGEEDATDSEPESVHTVISEEFIQACIIQRHERFRKYFVKDFKAKCKIRRMHVSGKVKEAPLELKEKAAKLIQISYRKFMRIKRQRVLDTKRDLLLNLIPNPFRVTLNYEEENNKIYETRRRTRSKLQEIFLEELEKEKVRLLVFKKEDQIDDITDEIREWFKEWYHGYGFFPEFPYELEGGSMIVVRGDYPTIEEQIAADEKYLAATKGKTKEQLKQEAIQLKMEAEIKMQLEKEQKKKDAEVMMKLRCNPLSDPGYQVQKSEVKQGLIDAFQKYRSAWSVFDKLPRKSTEVIYGFMQQILTEDLMTEIHKDCRKYVDELMRLELKLLIKVQQLMYKRIGKKYPKMRPREKPKPVLMPKILNVDNSLLKEFEPLFDLGIITKPKAKLKDILGDSNYAAYDLNISDPNATFPLPGYGDVKRRLIFSCVYGIGIDPGATRRKSVMLLGPPRNGKSFLVDAVAGELNAVKIDISPEVFGAKIKKPAKLLSKVFAAAKVFQPTVIYLRNVERVFAKKMRPEDKKLHANNIKSSLPKQLRAISSDDKIIFIATCSEPWLAKCRPLVSNFSEIILVPRTDYGTLQQFFYQKLQSIRSMPRDYNVYVLAQLLQGYGIGFVIELYNTIMNPERIVRLNIQPLSPLEFIEPLIEQEMEPVTVEDYQTYVEFFIKNSNLKKKREEYAIINTYREMIYRKIEEKKNQEAEQSAT